MARRRVGPRNDPWHGRKQDWGESVAYLLLAVFFVVIITIAVVMQLPRPSEWLAGGAAIAGGHHDGGAGTRALEEWGSSVAASMDEDRVRRAEAAAERADEEGPGTGGDGDGEVAGGDGDGVVKGGKEEGVAIGGERNGVTGGDVDGERRGAYPATKAGDEAAVGGAGSSAASGSKTVPELWRLRHRLLQQPILMTSAHLKRRGPISCGGTGTVVYRTWQEVARSFKSHGGGTSLPEDDSPLMKLLGEGPTSGGHSAPTCAIVGNSGRLLQGDYGPLIDAKQLVVRFNWGKVRGFERHVGSKSHFRLYNGPYVEAKEVGELTIAQLRDPAVQHWLHQRLERNASYAFMFDPEFLCTAWSWVGQSGEKPSSGLVGVILGLRLCSTIDAFGFNYGDYFNESWQPHYYDWERPKVGREYVHPFVREDQLYHELQAAGMLTLHS